MHDPISDLLTRIRNAGSAKLPSACMPHSKQKEAVAQVLLAEGYLKSVAVEGDVKKVLKLTLKYQGKQSVVTNLLQISRPGLRRYVGANSIPRVLGGLGIAIISTPKGILSDSQAKTQNQGGELLCYVW